MASTLFAILCLPHPQREKESVSVIEAQGVATVLPWGVLLYACACPTDVVMKTVIITFHGAAMRCQSVHMWGEVRFYERVNTHRQDVGCSLL